MEPRRNIKRQERKRRRTRGEQARPEEGRRGKKDDGRGEENGSKGKHREQGTEIEKNMIKWRRKNNIITEKSERENIKEKGKQRERQ